MQWWDHSMGETRTQRIELAIALREVRPESIPINILSPVKGTPLSDTASIDDEEILLTVAVFRFLHPGAELRFAGGRGRLSREVQLEALEIGHQCRCGRRLADYDRFCIDEDKALTTEAGYHVWL